MGVGGGIRVGGENAARDDDHHKDEEGSDVSSQAAALKQRCRRPFSSGANRWRGAQARLLLQHRQWVVLSVCSEAAEVAPTAQPRPPAHQADKRVIAPLGGRVRERPAQAVRPQGLLLVPGQVKVLQARLESLRKLVPLIDLVHAPNG